MGGRGLVIFQDAEEVSPVVYLHWGGSRVPALIEEVERRMRGRGGDVSYAAARFVGICHERIPGDLSLGVWNTPVDVLVAVETRGLSSGADEELAGFSHGDAGVVVVDARDFTWRAYGGYLAGEEVAAPSDAAEPDRAGRSTPPTRRNGP